MFKRGAYAARVTYRHQSPSPRDPPPPRRAPRRLPRPGNDVGAAARRDRRLLPRTRAIAWGVAGAGLLLLAALAFRQPLADWIWPETRAQALRAQAAQALARGHLSAPDGSGARELYEAAIAIDPDRTDARAGLARVAQAALARAEAALARDGFRQAHALLALARELEVPRAQANRLAERLRTREADVAGIVRLLAQADAARAAGRLDGPPDAALPLYARVLSLRPENIRALEGREDALSDLLQQARGILQRGDLPRAAALVGAARGYDPGHVDLPQLQGELTRAVDALRRRASRDLRNGRLPRAADAYRQLQRLDGEDDDAARGLAKVADALAVRAERAAADFAFDAAGTALDAARAIAPGADSVAHAQRRIAQARRTQARLQPAVPDARQRQRVAALLRDAAAAEQRGELLSPPGESAYDKLRAARSLAPADPAVRRAQARLVPAARNCFERELPRNDLGRARGCLEAWIALEGGDGATRRAQSRLAQRWLAVGDERLGAGDLRGAGAALRAAESSDRAVAGLEAFRQRLRAASASAD